MAEVNLSRAIVKGGFDAGALEALHRVAPLASALMRQHWRLVRESVARPLSAQPSIVELHPPPHDPAFALPVL
jgi:hypothetical protein